MVASELDDLVFNESSLISYTGDITDESAAIFVIFLSPFVKVVKLRDKALVNGRRGEKKSVSMKRSKRIRGFGNGKCLFLKI